MKTRMPTFFSWPIFALQLFTFPTFIDCWIGKGTAASSQPLQWYHPVREQMLGSSSNSNSCQGFIPSYSNYSLHNAHAELSLKKKGLQNPFMYVHICPYIFMYILVSGLGLFVSYLWPPVLLLQGFSLGQFSTDYSPRLTHLQLFTLGNGAHPLRPMRFDTAHSQKEDSFWVFWCLGQLATKQP